MQPENPMELATVRWEVLKEMLHEHGVPDKTIRICGTHWKQGFVAGFKEGLDYESGDEKEAAVGFTTSSTESEGEDDEEEADSGMPRARQNQAVR